MTAECSSDIVGSYTQIKSAFGDFNFYQLICCSRGIYLQGFMQFELTPKTLFGNNKRTQKHVTQGHVVANDFLFALKCKNFHFVTN